MQVKIIPDTSLGTSNLSFSILCSLLLSWECKELLLAPKRNPSSFFWWKCTILLIYLLKVKERLWSIVYALSIGLPNNSSKDFLKTWYVTLLLSVSSFPGKTEISTICSTCTPQHNLSISPDSSPTELLGVLTITFLIKLIIFQVLFQVLSLPHILHFCKDWNPMKSTKPSKMVAIPMKAS